MKGQVSLLVTLLTLSTPALTDQIVSMPPRGADLSFLHRIVGIHVAKSMMDEVWLMEVSSGAGDEITLALRVLGASRPPAGKIGRIEIWNLPYKLRTVESVAIVGTTVTIQGWTYDKGSLVCTASFSFGSDGKLRGSLQDDGCRASK